MGPISADPGLTPALPLLAGYPSRLQVQIRGLLASRALGPALQRNYPETHTIRSDGALHAHVSALKARCLRNVPALAKVAFDKRLQTNQRALPSVQNAFAGFFL